VSAALPPRRALWHPDGSKVEECKMPTPIETVTAFLDQCAQGKAQFSD